MTAEWASHNGDRCPVPDGAVVDIERRDGSASHGPAGLWIGEHRRFDSWRHNGGGSDIVRYRAALPRDEAVAKLAALLSKPGAKGL